MRERAISPLTLSPPFPDLPHPDDLSVPWNCGYINVECGGGAACLKKPCGRPGGENHKGTVDFWRRKKLSYPALAAVYA